MKYKVIKMNGEFDTELKNTKYAEGDFYYNYVIDGEESEEYAFDNIEEAKAELKKHKSEIAFEKEGSTLENGHFRGTAISWILVDEDYELVDFAPLKPITWEITDEEFNTLVTSDKNYDNYIEAINDCMKAVENIEVEYKYFFEEVKND